MKQFFAGLVLAFCALSLQIQAQAIRVDPTPVFTTGGNAPAGAYAPVLAIPGATVHVCQYPANGSPCTNYATTYTDSTQSTACLNSAQLVLAGTSSCVSTTDAQGNYGFWIVPGSLYSYTITTAAGVNYGPFAISPTVTSNASALNYTPVGGTTRTAAQKLGERPSFSDYGAKGDGATDDTAAIQLALNTTQGIVTCTPGIYKITSPIQMANGQSIVGLTQMAHYGFTSAGCILKPASTFSGAASVLVDPANASSTLPLTAGSFLQDVAVDMTNVNTSSCTVEAIRIASESNVPVWQNVTVLNNDCIGVHITKSANSGAARSEGITFENFYNYGKGIDTSNSPTVIIEHANEVMFRGGKILVRSNAAPQTGAVGVLIQGDGNNYWMEGVTTAGYYKHFVVQNSGGSGGTPIHARFRDCLSEGFHIGYDVSGLPYPDNAEGIDIFNPILITPEGSAIGVHLGSGTQHATVDSENGSVAATVVQIDSGANGNRVYVEGSSGVVDNGSANLVIQRDTGGNFNLLHGAKFNTGSSSGATANANAIVTEDNASTYWHHMLGPDASGFGFLFGSPSLTNGPQMDYEYSANRLQIAMPSTQFFRFAVASGEGVVVGSTNSAPNANAIATVYGNTYTNFLQLGSFASVSCGSTNGGQFNYVAGSTGIKDVVQVCAKDAANAWAWRTLY